MRPINVHEYEQLAQAQLHTAVWEYYSGGAYDEVTLHENRAAFERLQIRPRMLVDVSRVTRSTTVLGTPVSMPIGVAPTAVQGAACLEGECATAQGAGAVGALMIASTQSTRSLEEIAQAATGPLWFQLYFSSRTHGQATQLVRRAEAAGYRAIVVTVDSARWGRKERYLHSQETYEWPPYGNFAPELMTPIEDGNDDAEEDDNDAALTWQARVAPVHDLSTDSHERHPHRRRCEPGGEPWNCGRLVSNHGGRQLDTVPATIEALPEVVEAVAGHCEVYMDGGVRRGTDVLKALALGARAVFVGRPVLWGLAVAGAGGAQHVLELLRDELDAAMALAGRPTLAGIDATLVQRARS